MKQHEKFFPVTKMEENSDGTLFVFGTVTAQQPDLEREVCDYATTKLLYEKAREANLAKAVPGQKPSVMPFREMHQTKVQGAGRTMVFDDDAKTIKMGFEVVSAEAIKMWKAGCFVGFSQGGFYVKQWPDPEFEGCTRYTSDPIEVSAVDTPCLPSALVETMKGRTVQLMKASGVTEEVHLQIVPIDQARLTKAEREIARLTELLKEKKTKRVDGADLTSDCFAHVGDPDDPETWKLPIKFPGDEEKTKSHIRNALARFEQTEGMSADEKKAARKKIVAAAKEHGIEVDEAGKAAVSRACAKISLEKGLYEVGWLGDLLESLHWLCMQTEFERDMEDDGSKVPDDLRAYWLKLLEAFKDMAAEEADELAAQAGKGAKGMKIETAEQLKKAAKTIHDHLEKHMEMHKALHEKLEGQLAKDHPIMKAHQAMIDHCEKCMKAAKDSMDGEEPEAEPKEKTVSETELAKAVAAAVAPFQTKIDEFTELLKKTPANPPAHTGAVAEKTIDAEFGDLLTTAK